jgi:hypothetical protein
VPTPINPTRPALPTPAVTPNVPLSIFVPPPTIPSTSTPILFPPETAGHPLGRLVRYGLGMGISESYTDNFDLTSKHQRENFRTSILPGVTAELAATFLKGRLAYTLGVSHDSSAKEDDDINFFHQLAAAANWQASPRLSFSLSESFVRSDEPTLADRLNLRRVRRPFTSNVLSLQSDYQLEPIRLSASYTLGLFSDSETNILGLSSGSSTNTVSHTFGLTGSTTLYTANTVSLGYQYLTSRTDTHAGTSRTGATTRDSSETIQAHQLTATYARQINPRTTAGITGSFGWTTEDSNTNGTTGDYESWNVSVFNGYTVGPWTLAGSIGYGGIIRDSGNDSTITTTSSLSYRFARAIATVGVDSGFSQTFAQGQNFGVIETHGVTGSFSYTITPAISALATGSWRENQNTGNTNTLGSDKQTTWQVGARIGVRLTHWLSLSGSYDHIEASSSGKTTAQTTPLVNGIARTGDYVENVGSITLSAAF